MSQKAIYLGYRDEATGEPRPPNEKQRLAHVSTAEELLYGGAAGGGKSEFLIIEAAVTVLEVPGVEAALFRRTFEELEASLILRAIALIPPELGTYQAGRRRFVMRNGSILWFRYCANEKDVFRYQSAQWIFLGIDEATHFTEFQYTYLISRVRTRRAGIKCKVRLCTNPGNVGHAWVKRRFIAPESIEKGDTAVEPLVVWRPQPPPERPDAIPLTRCFIPAKLSDNTALMESDPGYYQRLMLLPEDERRMLADGDWDVWKGQMFGEFRAEHRVSEHDFELRAARLEVGTVIPWHRIADAAWEPPDGARIYMSVDYGYAAPWAVHAHAVLAGGRVITFKEFYKTLVLDTEQGKQIKHWIEKTNLKRQESGRLPLEIDYIVMDQSMWGSRREQGLGKSIAEVYADILLPMGIPLLPGSTDRHARVQRVKNALMPAPDGWPWWQITAACPNLLRTLPELPRDEDDPEDVDTDAEDHCYDECGIFWQSRPELPKVKAPSPVYEGLDPLSRRHHEQLDAYRSRRGKVRPLNIKGFRL